MSLGCVRNIIRNEVCRLKLYAFKHRITKSCFHSRKDTFYAFGGSMKRINAVERARLSFLPLKRVLCTSNSEMEEIQNNDTESFYHILKDIAGAPYISDISVLDYISRINRALDIEKLGIDQIRDIRETEPLVHIFSKIMKNLDVIPVKDVILTLEICRKLEMSFETRFCVAMLAKVASKLHELNLAELVDFLRFLEFKLPKEVALKLKIHIHNVVQKKINDKSYLKSLDGITAAINFGCIRRVSFTVRENILCDIIGLEVWDNALIYKKILILLSLLNEIQKKKLEELCFHGINEKIRKCNNVKFISDFIFMYGILFREKQLNHDLKLIDNAINRVMELNISNQDLKYFIMYIEDLEIVNHKLLEYVVKEIKGNSKELLEDHIFVKNLIHLLAHSNCDEETVNRWRDVAPILKNLPSIKMCLECSKKRPENYTFLLLELISLGIFMDEELSYLSELFNNADFMSYPVNTWLFLLSINQAVKIFHPTFPRSLLSDSFVKIILIGLFNKNPNWKAGIREMRKIFNPSESDTKFLLLNCATGLGFPFAGGVVAVNKDGEFYDFSAVIEGNHSKLSRNGITYLEDLTVPKEFKPIVVLFVNEQHHSNTFDVNPSVSLTIQILQALGYSTVLLYEKIFEPLKISERKEYLLRKVRDKYHT